MAQQLGRWIGCWWLLAVSLFVSGSVQAAVVVNATDLGDRVRFVVSASGELTITDMVLQLSVDQIFDSPEEFDAFPNGPGDWYTFGDVPDMSGTFQVASIYTVNGPGALLTLVGTVADVFSPVSFQSGSSIFDFEMRTFDPLTAPLDFSFEGYYLGGNGDLVQVDGSVAPIPEPSTYALMIAGLLGLGFVARRRRTG